MANKVKMIEKKYVLQRNFSDFDYHKLIELLFSNSDSFILTIRDDIPKDIQCDMILKELQTELIMIKKQSEFGDTKLFETCANVHYFKTSKKSMNVIISYSSSIFDWKQPLLPEDISFIEDDTYIFTCTAHENYAIMNSDMYSKITF